MKTKKDREYNFNHFKQRLKERFDLDITREEYEKMCSDVQEKFKPISIEKQKRDTQIVYVGLFKSTVIKVVWRDKQQSLTTVLPEPRRKQYD